MIDVRIYSILKTHKITDYLKKRGCNPDRQYPTNGRWSYKCPFPDHSETKPSFIVYTQGEYENFYCFGCQRGSTIIKLVSVLENIDYKTAINRLDKNVTISDEEQINILINLLEKQIDNKMEMDLGQSCLSLSRLCLYYLQSVNFNDKEVEITENFWNKIDDKIIDGDFDGIKDTLEFLPETLYKRRLRFEESSGV